jgi:threonine synthase
MLVHSTRGNKKIKLTQAIIKGLAEDGGLFVFEKLPLIDIELIEADSYQSLAKTILNLFFEDDMTEIVNQSYKDFNKDVIGLKLFSKFGFVELFHGPTFAFKDMALQLLPKLLNYSKVKEGDSSKTKILTATSGDTGSAAMAGFKNTIPTIILYPTNGISEFQEKQMLSLQSNMNIVIPVNGNFDDCQNLVKDVFTSDEFSQYDLSSANSINIGRILPQIIYYLYSYKALRKSYKIAKGEAINIVVPTGNFGNIYAAYLAKKMGLPIHKLIIASNENNVLFNLFNDAVYSISDKLKETMSPSMDILISSNLERYLYDLYEHDTETINVMMNTLKETGKVFVERIIDQNDFLAFMASEEDTSDAIESIYDQTSYVIDPHTAVGYSAYQQYVSKSNDDTYTLIAATASPFKFSSDVLASLNHPISDLKTNILTLSRLSSLDNRILNITDMFVEKPKSVDLHDLKQYLKNILGSIYED